MKRIIGSRKIVCRWMFCLAGILAAGVMAACGGGSGSSGSTDAGTCSMSFSINWNLQDTGAAAVGSHADGFQPEDFDACTDIETVTGGVYNSASGQLLRSGGPWPCVDHTGLFEDVPAGGSGFVVIYGRDYNDNAVLRGHSGDIALVADQGADAGVIEGYYFVPTLLAPADYATISTSSVDLVWEPVINAVGYALVVSTAEDLSNPVVSRTVDGGNTTTYTLNNLQPGTTYHWQVRAVDAQGTRGGYEAVWRFSVPSQGNTPPVATINSPADGAVFSPGALVVFNGSGSDAEDGDLSGSALAWSSSIDGSLGSGTVVQTEQLSLGIHTITLTVSDSQGASDSASIQIAVAEPGGQDISGLWRYSVAEPWAEGDLGCQPGPVTSGTCRISQFGNQFTLEFLTGWICQPSFTCTYSGTVDGDRYVGSNSGAADDAGGVVTNIIDFSVVGPETLSGSSYSRYENDGYICEWGYYGLIMVPETDPQNQPPAAVITSPSNNEVYNLGDPITFQGSGNDPEDGPLSGASLVWASNVDGQIGVGERLTYASLSAGMHQITLTAVDSAGATGNQIVTITINSPPAVTITSPAPGTRIDPGSGITLEGSALDPEDGPLDTAGLAWRSSIDGPLGTGGRLTVASLSYGRHTITATINDSVGAPGSSSAIMTVNFLPEVALNQPSNNSHFAPGIYIIMDATAEDVEDGESLPSSAFRWYSNLDGLVASGSYTGANTLTTGTHTLTCTATDSLGDSGSQSVTIVINTPPVANIDTPAAGSMFFLGDPIDCAGSWSDVEDAVLPDENLVWTYQELPAGPQVQFGTGTNPPTISFSDFGTVRIRFTVTDRAGDSTTATIDVDIAG